MSRLSTRRLLLVHAHPDDESINNGVTMARYAAEGAQVTLVTCTLGERGDIIPPWLSQLADEGESVVDPPVTGQSLTPLAAHRSGELDSALAELGVTDHRLLGGPGRYRDSGMMGSAENDHPGCFWRANLDQAAALLAEVVREVRPQVLVTYGPDGGYGHPDHVQAHRVAMRAAELAADPAHRPTEATPHQIARIYWNGVSRQQAEEGFARLRAAGPDVPFASLAAVEDVPGVMAEAEVAVAIAGDPGQRAAKVAAMRAHATQLVVHGEFFALSNGLGQPVITTEQYRLAGPDGAGPTGAGQPLDDLFAGIPGVAA